LPRYQDSQTFFPGYHVVGIWTCPVIHGVLWCLTAVQPLWWMPPSSIAEHSWSSI
jgi:hypothetical protein